MQIIITPATDATDSTPAVPAVMIDSDDIAGLVATYGTASTGEKTKIRNAITTGMGDAVKSMDITLAQQFVAMGEAIKTAPKVNTETDFNRVVADRIIALRYAAHRLIMGDVTPDGIDADKIDTDAVQTMVNDWIDGGDLDSVSDEQAAMGDKIAKAKITKSVVRGSVEESIMKAFADVPVGTKLTVSQIKTRSGAASGGAIGVRLWPAGDKITSLDLHAMGIELTDIDGTRAVRKIADV